METFEHRKIMQHYIEARKNYPISEIDNEVRCLQQLAYAQALQLHYSLACKYLERAEKIAVRPHQIKNMVMLRQEWQDAMIVLGITHG